MALGPIKRSAVKLAPDDEVVTGLHVAEGLETALAVWQRGLHPVWALGSAGAIKGFPIVGGIGCLTICADHDHPGLAAAQECAERWAAANREVYIRWPACLGRDFADKG